MSEQVSNFNDPDPSDPGANNICFCREMAGFFV